MDFSSNVQGQQTVFFPRQRPPWVSEARPTNAVVRPQDGVVTFAFAMDLSNVDCFSNPVPRGAPLVPRPALKRIVTEVLGFL